MNMKKLVLLFCLYIISKGCISQSYYKLEIQLLDKSHHPLKDTVLCVCKNDLTLWGSEVVTDKGLYIFPLDVSLCDSAYLSFLSYTNPNSNNRLYLRDISIISDSYKLGEYIVKINSFKAISESRYEKMMKRQRRRFFLSGWFQRNPSRAIDVR